MRASTAIGCRRPLADSGSMLAAAMGPSRNDWSSASRPPKYKGSTRPRDNSSTRARPGTAGAIFQQGDAMALPFEAERFDAAVMALTIAFVPDPARAVAEMARVVRPG